MSEWQSHFLKQRSTYSPQDSPFFAGLTAAFSWLRLPLS